MPCKINGNIPVTWLHFAYRKSRNRAKPDARRLGKKEAPPRACELSQLMARAAQRVEIELNCNAAMRRSAVGVHREKAALSSGCKSHPANAPAGSNRSSHGGDEMAEAFGVASHIGTQ